MKVEAVKSRWKLHGKKRNTYDAVLFIMTMMFLSLCYMFVTGQSSLVNVPIGLVASCLAATNFICVIGLRLRKKLRKGVDYYLKHTQRESIALDLIRVVFMTGSLVVILWTFGRIGVMQTGTTTPMKTQTARYFGLVVLLHLMEGVLKTIKERNRKGRVVFSFIVLLLLAAGIVMSLLTWKSGYIATFFTASALLISFNECAGRDRGEGLKPRMWRNKVLAYILIVLMFAIITYGVCCYINRRNLMLNRGKAERLELLSKYRNNVKTVLDVQQIVLAEAEEAIREGEFGAEDLVQKRDQLKKDILGSQKQISRTDTRMSRENERISIIEGVKSIFGFYKKMPKKGPEVALAVADLLHT